MAHICKYGPTSRFVHLLGPFSRGTSILWCSFQTSDRNSDRYSIMINIIIIFLFVMYSCLSIVNREIFQCMRSQHFSFINAFKSTPSIFLSIISFYNITFKTYIRVTYLFCIIPIIHRIMSHHAHNMSFNTSYHIISYLHVTYDKT